MTALIIKDYYNAHLDCLIRGHRWLEVIGFGWGNVTHICARCDKCK